MAKIWLDDSYLLQYVEIISVVNGNPRALYFYWRVELYYAVSNAS